ncbi:site-specific integrase [Rummeliibacillus sp. TYF005]|uniref:tyrosine-type recombinase/integrase n=1 Tax=Rummeliibacillus sp. TYF005 TaxID=2058214 RepID=UPI000F543767|nr:site-specific integrase [Rummeliibacillus sp. TYF005]RPJ97220.1 site-specific integrase [Rummeliibacillus sp. TYF005]
MTKKSGVFDVDFDGLLPIETKKKNKKKDIESRTIDNALEIVIRQMIASGYRKRTTDDYRRIVSNFEKAQGIKYLSEITMETIYNWLDKMNVANQTKLTRLKSLKSFLSKCFNNGWYETKFWASINVKVDKKIKQGTKPSDIDLLLSLLDLKTFVGLRDATAILTMYKTGIRINTLGQLEEKHIDFNEGVLKLDGDVLKNHKYLKLPLDNQLLHLYKVLIQQNNKVRNYYHEDNSFIFISYKGKSLNTKSTNNAISKQLTKYSKKYGLKNINAHAIRRAYAKNLLKKGANLALISKALGHSNLEVTTQYLDLDVDEVAENLRNYL